MWQERIQRYLLAGDVEEDPGFRDEILRLGHMGLQVIGALEIGVTLVMVTANLLLDPNPRMIPGRLIMGALVILIGVLTLGAARLGPLYRFSRPIACISGMATAAVLTWFFLLMTRYEHSVADFIPGNMTLVMLVMVAAMPLRPVHTLLFGSLVESMYVILALAAQEFYKVPAGVAVIFVIFIFLLTCLATALSAVVYDQRRSTWEWHTRMLQAAENLRQAEARNLLAQNAASVGRLAAALSHELNSPIGALVSGVDTLLLLASRQATCAGPDQQRLVVLQNELRKSIRDSSDRLKSIVARMQRFTNLDKAEVQAANVNELLTDVSALLEPNYDGRAKIELDLQPVPELVCRPQQLSAVFANLLGNAIEATNGSGCVRVATRQLDSLVQVEIQDNGRGLNPDDVKDIFDPGFKVSQGRVSTGNWSMFSSRQIIREHGGDIAITSMPGEGTRVQITLPLDSQLRA